MKRRIRILAALLALVMVLGAVPAVAADSPDAVSAVDAYLENFTYAENGRRYFESCGGWEFWQCVESIEVVIDAYDQTGDRKYLTAAKELYDGFIAGSKSGSNRTDWSGNDYNDDIMWGVIASARLYLLTGEGYYLEVAKSNFDMCYARGWDESFLGGGMWWKDYDSMDNPSKNACIECPAAIAACLLGDATGDSGYYDKAKALIDWTIENLYQEDGALWDSVYTNKDPNKWCSTYNQGTFIGACTMLSKHFDDVDYLSYAKKAAQRATRLNLNGEQNTGDLIGFKGILARWLGYYSRESGDDSFVEYMRSWSQTVWNNRNSDGLMWTRFDSETPDDLKNQTISNVDAGSWGYWGCSAAVSWVVNTPGTVDQAHTLSGITAGDVSVSAGETAEIAVTFAPADTLAKGLRWQAADETVARIDSVTDEGAVIYGVGEGTTTVTAVSVANPGVSMTVQVTVTPSRYITEKIEAEEGVLSQDARISDNGSASGGKHVGYLGGEDNDHVTFTVTSPVETAATLKLYYATAQTREFGVVVNGGETRSVSVGSTGDWTEVAKTPAFMEISLKAGENTILVGGTGGSAPNLDYIEVVYLRPEEFVNPFTDVFETDYYYAPVLWAAQKGITTGDGASDIFNPQGDCTRAQVVTFLWRMAGTPEAEKAVNPFEDVTENSYYYKAVLWAVEQGITTGTTETTFSPNETCIRAQVAAFLWRYAGKPESGGENPFTDLLDGAYYVPAVAWAAEQGITIGDTNADTFNPYGTCTRAQIVTFLYRYTME